MNGTAAEEICGHVKSVRPGSPAERAGVRAGDCVTEVGGHPVHDVLDIIYHASEADFTISVRRGGAVIELRVTRDPEEGDLGLDFYDPLFDGVRQCRNRCDFCFVSQLPTGVRRSLLIKDDDYRLSFLYGNFVTLTNLDEADWARIGEQHLGPLYVSVHATKAGVRNMLLGAPTAPDVVEQIRRLGSLHIPVHTQVVLVPGANDGQVLAHTLGDLQALYPTVQSVSVVPVGLTRFHRPCIRAVSRAEAWSAVRLVQSVERQVRPKWSIGWAYASDELLLLAGAPVPSAARYDGFPQIENGIGLIRWFLEDWRKTRRKMEQRPRVARRRATVVTGTLFAPFLEKCARAASQLLGNDIRTVAVRNRWLGDTVTVAGLLSAGDVVDECRDVELGDVAFVPRAMLDRAGERTLDGMTPGQLVSALGTGVEFVDSMSEVVQILVDR